MAFNSVISAPTPTQSNPPINPQYFQPSVFFITAITNGITTTITTSVNHNYVVGQSVRVIIPRPYGETQISGQTGNVLSIPAANQVVVSINSLNVDAFNASGTGKTKPQISAIGDINSGVINNTGRVNTGTYILGSFINISPL